jgi:hypothetical protein
MKKFSTCILDQNVPEEDIEATQEDAVSQENEEVVEGYSGSLFSFNFLNEEGHILQNKGFEEPQLHE